MKFKFLLIALMAVFVISCSTTREPASAQEEKELTHQQYQGYFDRPIP